MASVTLPDQTERDVQLPVEVRRADAVIVSWIVPLNVASQVMTDAQPAAAAELEPVPMARGRAMVSMPFVRYMAGDLGAYNEMGLAFVVRRRGDAEVASYVAHLPVDGEFTCAAGRQLWGFPKRVADELTVERTQRSTKVRLESGDGSTITVTVARGWLPLPDRQMSMTTWAAADGELLATPFTMHTRGLRARPAGATLKASGVGPMATDVRALGLDQRRPISSLWVSQLTGTFGPALRVKAASDSVPA